VICIDARHAKAVLKMQINKNDRNDAIGIARIMQTGWFKEVHVKDIDSHSVRALLASRALLLVKSTPPAAAALRSGLGIKNLSLWTEIGAAPKSSGFRWWTQAGDGGGLRRRSSRSLWRAFRVPARSRQRHGDTAFRGRCCCDGGDLFIPSQRMPPAHNWASSQRSWSQIQR